MTREAQRVVHDAIGAYLDEGEIAISWTLTIDVAGPDGTRYLAHRGGGGPDGTESPPAWVALGMMESSVDLAHDQLRDMTQDVEDQDDEDDE